MPHKQYKPFKKKIEPEAKSVEEASPKDVPKAKATTPPASTPRKVNKEDLPWKSIEQLSRSLRKGDPSEKTLKAYATILGIDYDPNFEVFYSSALAKFRQIFH
tara:strand:- start:385 stop:693 length:309 start_codon:yes stop_codon:yes gene_type:complete